MFNRSFQLNIVRLRKWRFFAAFFMFMSFSITKLWTTTQKNQNIEPENMYSISACRIALIIIRVFTAKMQINRCSSYYGLMKQFFFSRYVISRRVWWFIFYFYLDELWPISLVFSKNPLFRPNQINELIIA